MGEHANEVREDVFCELGRGDDESGERGEGEDDDGRAGGCCEIFADEVVGKQDDLCARGEGEAGCKVSNLFDVEPWAGHALEDVEGVGEDGWVAEHLEVDELEDGSCLYVPVAGLYL